MVNGEETRKNKEEVVQLFLGVLSVLLLFYPFLVSLLAGYVKLNRVDILFVRSCFVIL